MPYLISKPSVSGLMSPNREVARFENLFFKRINSAYYFPEWGLDWDTWLDQNYILPTASLSSYIVQESMKNGIVINEITAKTENFSLRVLVKIDGYNDLHEITGNG